MGHGLDKMYLHYIIYYWLMCGRCVVLHTLYEQDSYQSPMQVRVVRSTLVTHHPPHCFMSHHATPDGLKQGVTFLS